MSDDGEGTRIQYMPTPPPSAPRPEPSLLDILKRVQALELEVRRLKEQEPVINEHDDRLDAHDELHGAHDRRHEAHEISFAHLSGAIGDVRGMCEQFAKETSARGLVLERVDRGLLEILAFVRSK